MNKTLTLDAFKNLVQTSDLTDEICGRCDSIDYDNGTMRIYSEHISKYLEKYACKDTLDLSDTLWYNYGIFLEIKE